MIYILGNCALESWEIYLQTAETLYPIMKGKEWYFKASFDKANRTSIKGKRGIGLNDACVLFKSIKQVFPDIKLLTDVHTPDQVEKLKPYIDVIQVPAFLGRQTDLIVECARHFNKINVKRMQHLGPNNLIKSVDKIKETNPDCEAWLCDRGSNYGYDHLIMDFTIINELKEYYDKVVFDCTHSVQRSRTVHGKQGDRELAMAYFLSAPVFEYDGLFAEIHPDPPSAISDGDCQIYLSEFENLYKKHKKICQSIT
jgi:2-dehydro-3-deoxyphosphooctonate aldolase (KDO 8-P synthase)